MPALDSLGEFLFSLPALKLPVTPHCYHLLQQDPACAELVQYFTADTSAFELAAALSGCVLAAPVGTTEPWTADNINRTVVPVLTTLDRLVPIGLNVGLIWERDEGDADSGLTMLSEKLRALRPDGLIRHADGTRMLMKWEEKGAGHIAGALADITAKAAAVWPTTGRWRTCSPLQLLGRFSSSASWHVHKWELHSWWAISWT